MNENEGEQVMENPRGGSRAEGTLGEDSVASGESVKKNDLPKAEGEEISGDSSDSQELEEPRTEGVEDSGEDSVPVPAAEPAESEEREQKGTETDKDSVPVLSGELLPVGGNGKRRGERGDGQSGAAVVTRQDDRWAKDGSPLVVVAGAKPVSQQMAKKIRIAARARAQGKEWSEVAPLIGRKTEHSAERIQQRYPELFEHYYDLAWRRRVGRAGTVALNKLETRAQKSESQSVEVSAASTIMRYMERTGQKLDVNVHGRVDHEHRLDLSGAESEEVTELLRELRRQKARRT